MSRIVKQCAIYCVLAAIAFETAPALGQFGGGRPADQVAESDVSEEPKSLIAVTVWVLALEKKPEPESDQESNVAERKAVLPPVIGSIDDARKLIRRMQGAGLVRSMREIRVLALDGQKALAQVGANEPRVVATARSDGQRTNSVQYEPTGTIIRLEPSIDAESNIQISFMYEASLIEKSSDVVLSESEDESTLYADVIATEQLETTTSVRSGSAVLLHSDVLLGSEKNAAGHGHTLIILGAETVGASE